MFETHERPSLESPRSWRIRAAVLVFVTISYGAIFYGFEHMRPPQSTFVDGRQMFTPVVSQIGEQRAGITRSKPQGPVDQGPSEELGQSTPPPTHWKFAPIDLSPSPPGWAATVSEFTPVTYAEPDQADVEAAPPGQPAPKSTPRKSILQMVRWFRPIYDAAQCAAFHAERPLVLDLLIDPSGQPREIATTQSSGAPRLEDAVLRAARSWRFAPPLWGSQPVEVRGRVELRFNC